MGYKKNLLKKASVLDKNYINLNPRYFLIDKVVKKFAKGKILDVGCGSCPYKEFFIDVEEYIGVDTNPTPDQEYIVKGDAMSLPFEDNYFDTVVTFELLEHVPDPFKVFSEIHRVIKKGGILILTACQMWNLHEEPNDYYRFTKYGLKYLCEKNDFKLILHESSGSFYGRIGIKISYKLESLVKSNLIILSSAGKFFRLLSNLFFNFINKKTLDKKDVTGNLIVAQKNVE